jgi:hypothetical protein
MRTHRLTNGGVQTLLSALAFCMAGLTGPQVVSAQTAEIYGSLGNFDVVNNTGHNACGFEVEIEGASPAEIGSTFSVNRYGVPEIAATPAGTVVRWKTAVDASGMICATQTVPHAPNSGFGGTCYQWNPTTYPGSGCEHFGIGLYKNPGKVTSRWLAPDPANPGQLAPTGSIMAIAQPYYYPVPPAVVNVGAAPQIAVEVEAPEPAEAPSLYGDAQWMRIYLVQVPREVTLDELLTDNTLIPQDLTQLESDWQIVQDEPVAGGNGKRKRHRNQGSLLPTTQSVVRRIELHEFTGAYDPVTHEALCADGLCNVPAADEIGDVISAQMTAVLVQTDTVGVTKAGNGSGNVDSVDRLISCGSKCVVPYEQGTLVQLTAKPSSNSSFAGWTGACAGTQLTCAVTATSHVLVGATFNATPKTGGGGGGGGGGTTTAGLTLSVKSAGGKGLITSSSGAINCGKSCSTTVAAGTSVTLNASPEPGFFFVNWTGACTGNAPTCTIAVNSTATAQANFNK